MELKRVTRQEFEHFLKLYPRPVKRGTTYFHDGSSIVHFNDYTLGKISVIATVEYGETGDQTKYEVSRD